MIEVRDFEFFGIRCQVWKIPDGSWWASAPWRFRVWRPNGTQIDFVGVPNYCPSWRSAMMRARARCRWIADGTYDLRYN
jgi:hypothetical protein